LRGCVPEPKPCHALFMGSMQYERALRLQMRISEAKKRGFVDDVLLLLEHPPTITLGRNGKWTHLLVPEETLAARGVVRCEVDRGGDITYHGPGQLVGYPILELRNHERDVRRYMRNLEELILRVLNSYGIRAARHDDLTGVWTDGGKIAAMGVHISRWITRHGFALNVSTDLSFFDLIVPCGVSGARVASMASVLQEPIEVEKVAHRLIPFFGTVFERSMTILSEADLDRRINGHAQQSAVA
jgi:lipoyl(octanoyl) transferase